MPTLRRSEDVLALALDVLRSEQDRLAALGVPGEVILVGGASVPGALTVGDVDLHLRVPPTATFAAVLSRLRHSHPVLNPEAWAPTLAVFAVRAPLPAGLAVTPAGSEHDLRFTRCWQLLAADPALLAQYNAFKRSAVGTCEYSAKKSAFFDHLISLWPAHPAGGTSSFDRESVTRSSGIHKPHGRNQGRTRESQSHRSESDARTG